MENYTRFGPLSDYQYLRTLLREGYKYMGDKADWSEDETREWNTQVSVNQPIDRVEILNWVPFQTHVLHGEHLFATHTGART